MMGDPLSHLASLEDWEGTHHPMCEPSLAVREYSKTANHVARENRCHNSIHLGRGGKLQQTPG